MLACFLAQFRELSSLVDAKKNVLPHQLAGIKVMKDANEREE